MPSGLFGTNNGGPGELGCQLCRFDGHNLKILHRFKGESIYNIRVRDQCAMLPVEQDALYRYDQAQGISLVQPRHLHMGHYDFAWSNKRWFTSEKQSITADNKSQLWTQHGMLCQSSEYTWKEFVLLRGKIYLAAYFIHRRKEAGIVTIDQHTGKLKLLAAYRGGTTALSVNTATNSLMPSSSANAVKCSLTARNRILLVLDGGSRTLVIRFS